MEKGFLFCAIISEPQLRFNTLNVSSGIYIIHEDTFNVSEKLARNVCILVIPKQLKRLDKSYVGGSRNLTTNLSIFFDYLFLRTNKTYYSDIVHQVSVDLKKRKIVLEKRNIDFIDDYEVYTNPHYTFSWGSDRHNYFTPDSLNKIRSSIKDFKNYKVLVKSRLLHDKEPPLYTAMNLFDSVFANQTWDETKFIIAVSILEALFSTSTSELSFRLSLNISKFLYPSEYDFNKRLAIAQDIKNLYNYRSRIVHGTRCEIPKEDFDKVGDILIKVLEKIVKNRSIQKFFLSNEEHKRFIKNLEFGKLLKK